MIRTNLRAAFAASLVLFGVLAPAAPAFANPAQPISGATISPTSVEAGTGGHTFDVTYQVSSSAFRGYAGSQIPATWTRPQRTTAGGPGYVQAVPGTCSRISLAHVSSSASGPWTVAIDANCKANQTFILRYSGATAPTAAGPNTFASGSMLNSSSSIQPVSPQPVVTVRPGPAASLAVEGFPSPTTAGTPGSVTVTGVDRFGNRNAPLSGDVALSSSDPGATLSPPAPLVDGTRRFGATLVTAGTQRISAASTTTPSIAGTQSGIEVTPGPLSRIELSPATATVPAGVSQTYTAEGFDAYGNSRGSVAPSLSISPSGSCAPAACSDTVAGPHEVTGTVDGVSDTAVLNVASGQPTGFELTGVPTTTAAGTGFNVGVRARDDFGNTATNYSGPVVFSSTDPQAGLPPRSTLSGGQGTFTVQFRTAGPQTFTVADQSMPALSTTSSSVDVTPGPATRIVLDPATASLTAGESQTYTARAADAYGNDRGPVEPTLSITPDGSCTGLTCTTASAGTKTVRATHDGVQGVATLHVSPEVVVVGPETLPAAGVSEPYAAQFTADGALGGARFAVRPGGSLPPGLSLAPNGALTGTPTALGTFAFTVVATDGNGVSGERAYELVVRDVFTASPSPADFGSVAVTAFADRTITVTNNGSRTVTFNFVGVNDDWNFPSFAGCFGNRLEPGASCTQTPRFQPRTEGPHNGTLSMGWYDVADTSVSGTITVPLTGVGTPRFTASPSPADFGSVAVTGSAERSITVTNNGSRAVRFNFVGVNDEWVLGSFDGCFGTELAPGASCTQSPRFQPRTEGFHSGTLSLGWQEVANTSVDGTITVPLTGVATSRFSATPSPADFGNVAVANSAERTITVTNNGSRAVRFNFVGVNDEWVLGSFDGCFGTELAPGASCTQSPRFQPRTEGPHSGTLSLGWQEVADTSVSGTITVPMTGVGAPRFTFSPSPADFGSVAVTGSAERTITVTNNGSRAVRFNFVGVNDEWVLGSFDGCFGTELAPGASCTQSPRFQPRTEGPHSGTLTLGWQEVANTSVDGTITVPLTGVATSRFSATPSPADFGSVAVTSSAERTITVTNNGSRAVRFNFVGVNDEWNFASFAGCFGTELAPGASCTQTPRFSPRTEGYHWGTLSMGWQEVANTSVSGTITVPLTGVATPRLTASPSPAQFGSVAVTNSSERTITVTNNGSRPVRFNFVGVDDDWNFASFAGCFGTELAPGASCTQTPRFSPRTEGPHNGTLSMGWQEVADTSVSGTVTVPMTGFGAPELRAAPSPADFGAVPVTNSAERTITVTNHGTRTVRFNFVGVDDDWHFASFAGCFGTELAPGASCTQTPRFAPQSEGLHRGTLSMGWNDTVSTSRTGTVRVAMTGVGTPELSIAPNPADFGDIAVGSSSDRNLTVTNHGTRTVRFSFVGVDNEWSLASFAGCFGTELAPGATCTQTPRFTPQSEGLHYGTLSLGWHDTVSTSRTGSITAALRGRGTGEVAPSPGYADFGDVAVTNSADRTISFTNTGTSTLSFNFVGVTDDWHFASFAGCFGTRLAPGETCTQTPRFQPKSTGPHSGTLTVGWYDVADTSRTGRTVVALAGVGTPELTASPSPLAFGDVAVGSQAERTVTVTNRGTKTVRFNFVGVDGHWNFASFAGCFGTELAPGASCTQTPRFSPREYGAHAGTLTLGWNDVASSSRSGTLSVPMTGHGV